MHEFLFTIVYESCQLQKKKKEPSMDTPNGRGIIPPTPLETVLKNHPKFSVHYDKP